MTPGEETSLAKQVQIRIEAAGSVDGASCNEQVTSTSTWYYDECNRVLYRGVGLGSTNPKTTAGWQIDILQYCWVVIGDQYTIIRRQRARGDFKPMGVILNNMFSLRRDCCWSVRAAHSLMTNAFLHAVKDNSSLAVNCTPLSLVFPLSVCLSCPHACLMENHPPHLPTTTHTSFPNTVISGTVKHGLCEPLHRSPSPPWRRTAPLFLTTQRGRKCFLFVPPLLPWCTD